MCLLSNNAMTRNEVGTKVGEDSRVFRVMAASFLYLCLLEMKPGPDGRTCSTSFVLDKSLASSRYWAIYQQTGTMSKQQRDRKQSGVSHCDGDDAGPRGQALQANWRG